MVNNPRPQRKFTSWFWKIRGNCFFVSFHRHNILMSKKKNSWTPVRCCCFFCNDRKEKEKRTSFPRQNIVKIFNEITKDFVPRKIGPPWKSNSAHLEKWLKTKARFHQKELFESLWRGAVLDVSSILQLSTICPFLPFEFIFPMLSLYSATR